MHAAGVGENKGQPIVYKHCTHSVCAMPYLDTRTIVFFVIRWLIWKEYACVICLYMRRTTRTDDAGSRLKLTEPHISLLLSLFVMIKNHFVMLRGIYVHEKNGRMKIQRILKGKATFNYSRSLINALLCQSCYLWWYCNTTTPSVFNLKWYASMILRKLLCVSAMYGWVGVQTLLRVMKCRQKAEGIFIRYLWHKNKIALFEVCHRCANASFVG